MNRGRTILLTGASGFIGTHLAERLVAGGDSVRALYRREKPPEALVSLRERFGDEIRLCRAELEDHRRIAEALEDVEAVIHTAALALDWGRMDSFVRTNYDATVQLLEASRKAGVKTFLYVSSAAVQGFGPHVDSTEEGPYYHLKYPYPITKKMAEDYVLSKNEPGFKVTAIRPCNVYGPGDKTSTYAMYQAILDGVFGYIGGGEALTCPLYIDDLCAGTLAALEAPETAGQIILLTDGSKVSWKEYCRVMYAAVGSKKKPKSLPTGLAALSASIMCFGARLMGSSSPPPLTSYRVEQASHDYHFSNAKARQLIGFSPTVYYEEGLFRTAEAFLKERLEKS
jgi:nucleoside-diphosphate-sugar epimerase